MSLRHVVLCKANGQVRVGYFSFNINTTRLWNTHLTLLHVSTIVCHHREWFAQITICSAPVFKLLYDYGFFKRHKTAETCSGE